MKHAIIIFTIFLVASSFLPLDIPQAQALAYTCVGCTETTSGGNTIVTFTSSGTFTPTGSGTVEYLVIAGGGGGGDIDSNYGGGGGAGGMRTASGFAVTAQTYTITVGAGGAGSTTNGVDGTNGNNSIFSTITSTGGGGGGWGSGVSGAVGKVGGSGGGGGGVSKAGGAGTSGQGNAGGASNVSGWAGGGGGAGSVGGDASQYNGDKGAGLANSITGASVTYAEGGTTTVLNGATGTTPRANRGDGGGINGVTGGTGIVILSFSSLTTPDAPTALAATASSSSVIGLTWTAPANNGGASITGYKIEYESPTAGGFSVLSADTGTSATSYSSTGLTANTQYNYRVSAINSVGTSVASSASASTTYLAAPTSLAATASSASVIGLTWTAPSGTVTGYKIEYESPTAGGFSVLSANTGTSATSYSSTGLTANTQYNYRVSAINSAGTSAASSASASTTYLAAPTALTATPSSTSVIGLTWTAPSGTVTGYKIERESPTGGGFSVISANTGTSATSYSSTGLTASTEYNYRVSAINSAGTSAASSAASANTHGVPSQVTGLAVTTTSTSVLGLTWSTPAANGAAITGYKIERSLDNSSWSTVSADTGNTNTSYSDTGLSSGTQYYYRVSAINSNGNGSASASANTFTLNNAPTLFSISGNSTDTSAIDFAWTAPSGTVTGYHLECEDPVGTGFVDAVANTGTSATTYQATGLASNIIYNCKASAINAGGESASSNQYTATTFHVPDGVDDLAASPTNLSTMALTWSTPTSYAPSILGYQINYTSSGGSPLTIFAANTGTSTTSATITGLTISATYGFRVSAITIHGTNATGNIVESATTSNYELGDLTTPDIENTNGAAIFYDRTDPDDTTINLDVTYPDTFDLSCDVTTKFARTNQTYSNLDQALVTAETVKSTLQFTGEKGNDIINVNCYDEITGTSQIYVVYVDQFPFLDQIDNFRNGTYGTFGMIGAIDGISLMVVIIGMIGFNRINDFAGVIFTIIAVGALSAFGIIQLWEIVFPILALIVVVAYGKTRHDQD